MAARTVAAIGTAGALVVGLSAGGVVDGQRHELEGRELGRSGDPPSVQAAFARESYRPGDRARLVVRHRTRNLVLQILESGPERIPTADRSVLNGVAVTPERSLGRTSGRRVVTVRIGRWRSGVYFARLTAADGRVGYAPFVVAPRRLGEHRVAVVLPTLTWQAYNFRDDDGDGRGDTWYADVNKKSVRLGRPYLDRGVPYGYRNHLGFLNWLHLTHKRVDYLSQWDLEQAASPALLARRYKLIVFAGHHEYVTIREYDLVEGYRDLGGNLMFLSANNFFWRVARDGAAIEKSRRWRDLGRPEAALVGVQYVGNRRSPRGAWVIRRTPARGWMFSGTELRIGSGFGRGGVEIDQVTGASPRNVRVVAEIPRLFGPGMKAQMTYYETGSGARVFAAGAFHLTRWITSDPVVARLLQNLWRRMVKG